jgi:carbon monoxide dehydrogenase subunit G
VAPRIEVLGEAGVRIQLERRAAQTDGDGAGACRVHYSRQILRNDKHRAAHAQQPNQGFLLIEGRLDLGDRGCLCTRSDREKDRRWIGPVYGDQAARHLNRTLGERRRSETMALAQPGPALGRIDAWFSAHAPQYAGYDQSMKVEGAYTFPGSQQKVWDLLLDPESLRTCIPGAESLTETSPDHWDVLMKVGVAAIKGTYKGKVAIVEKEEPSAYTLQIEGSGGPGFVKGTARISLEPDGEGTHVKVEGDGQVGGMLAGVGQRMLPGVAKMLMNQFFECQIGKLNAQ